MGPTFVAIAYGLTSAYSKLDRGRPPTALNLSVRARLCFCISSTTVRVCQASSRVNDARKDLLRSRSGPWSHRVSIRSQATGWT